jgi:hypothetical protein
MEGRPIAGQHAAVNANASVFSRSVFALADCRNLLRTGKPLLCKMLVPKADSQVYLTVNGRKMADFSKGFAKVLVYNGDYVRIDGLATEQKVRIAVETLGADLGIPDGLVVEGRGDRLEIGKIKF